MELTKEQIQFIDYRLENDGIKYWDVRIELLDHTVSYVEKRLTQKEDFKKLVHEAFVNLGWKGNFNGGGLEKVFLSINISNYRKVRRKYEQEIKSKFTNIPFLVSIFVLWLFLFFIYKNNFLVKTIFSLEIVSNIFFLKFFITKYQLFKSAKLNAVFSFAVIPVSVYNLLIFGSQVFFNFEKFSSFIVVSVLAFIIPFLYIGFNFMLKEVKLSEKIYNKLLT